MTEHNKPANGNGEKMKLVAENSVLGLVAKITQLVGIPVALFFAGWIINSIDNLSTSVAKNNTDIAALSTKLDERTNDRYTATDARHDFATIDVQLEDIKRRVGVLEDNGRLKTR